MRVDDIAALSAALKAYQREDATDQAEARLAIALTRVVEHSIRPSLAKRLKPQDVDDICSEVILGFWKFRRSVRPDEVEQLVNTLAQRKQADQVRSYYKEGGHFARQLSSDERDLLEKLPDRGGDPAGEASQQVWELLYDLGLSAQDHLVAYTLYLGIDKQIVGEMLGMSGSAVTRSLQRCRQALARRSGTEAQKDADA